MKVIDPCAARFDTTKIYLRRDYKKGNAGIVGHTVWIGGIFKLGVPPIKPRQFVGIQRCLFFTMDYPDYVGGILEVAADLPGLVPHKVAVWSGTLRCSTDKYGLWYYLSKDHWDFRAGLDPEKTIVTSSEVSVVRGNRGGIYYILKFPLITREYLAGKYKPVFKRSKKSVEPTDLA